MNEKNRSMPDGPIHRLEPGKALVLAEVLAETAQRVQATGSEFAEVLRMLDCDQSPVVARLLNDKHPLPPPLPDPAKSKKSA